MSERGRLDPKELAGEIWATCARGSDAHRALEQVARAAGIEPDIRHHVADHSTQLALVRAGLAIACIPTAAERPATPGVAYRRLASKMHRDVLLLAGARRAPRTVEALVAHLTGPDSSWETGPMGDAR